MLQEAVLAGVVLVNGVQTAGLGFIVEKNRVVTAHHVAGGGVGTEVTLFFVPDFRKAKGRVIRYDPQRDLSLIETKTKAIVPLMLARDALRGEQVSWYFSHTVDANLESTTGIIEEKISDLIVYSDVSGQTFLVQDKVLPMGREPLLTLSGTVAPRSSGGPVFNRMQHVVGVILSRNRYELKGHAISVDSIRAFLNPGRP